MSKKMDKMLSDFEKLRLLQEPMRELDALIERINKAIIVSRTITENCIEGDIIISNNLLEQMELVKIKAEGLRRALRELYSDYSANL